jgi:hypothetical protein
METVIIIKSPNLGQSYDQTNERNSLNALLRENERRKHEVAVKREFKRIHRRMDLLERRLQSVEKKIDQWVAKEEAMSRVKQEVKYRASEKRFDRMLGLFWQW